MHSQSTSSLYFLLGGNPKVKISIQTMFSLAHHHGNMLREGWKNLLDCLLTLFSAKLLPECMVEVRHTHCPTSMIVIDKKKVETTFLIRVYPNLVVTY